jgi:AcrR family transcriptional regulator
MTARVRPGLFFDAPAALPRGRHQLSREEVHDAQRMRLMIAFTELLADRGYASVRIGDIAARAGVSSQSFYDVFANKEDCALAAYDHFIGVLARYPPATIAASASWREYVQAVIARFFSALTTDPVVARAFLLEIDAVGATARQRRREAVGRLAEVGVLAQEALRKTDPQLQRRPLSVHLSTLYGVRQLTCDVLESARNPDLEELAGELVDWIVAAWHRPP